MNNKIRKALSLLIALGMLSGAVPQVLADNESVEQTASEETAAAELPEDAAASEETAVAELPEEAASSEETSLEEIPEEAEAELLATKPGFIVDKNFDDLELGKYDGVSYGKLNPDDVTFEVIDGAEVGKENSKVLKVHQNKGTGEKMTFTGASISLKEYGARKVITSFDFRADSTSTFNITLANGNSNKNVAGGFRMDGGNIQIWGDGTHENELYYVKTGIKYNIGEWHKLVMVTEMNADNEVIGDTYYIDGVKSSYVASKQELFNDARVPTMFRLDFNKAGSNADFYIDNFAMVDVLPAAESAMETLSADETFEIPNYIITENNSMVLPTEYNGNKLVWESSDKAAINTDAISADGTVPVTHVDTDKDVTLTAKIAIGGMYGIDYPADACIASTTGKEFAVTVQNNSGTETDQSKANRIAQALKLESTTVEGDFVLPTTTTIVDSGATITWSSEDTSIINIDGANAKVTRPAFDDQNKVVKIVATVKYGTATATRAIGVTVVRNSGPVNDVERVRYAESELKRMGFTELMPITASISLDFLPSIGDAQLTWVSGDQAWLSNDGVILQQPEKGTGNHEVPVALTITSGSETKILNFVIAIQPKQAAKAYPGAQGYGTQTRGGAGGYVYHVTTLAADGPGSLKYGMETAVGNRIIVFDVGGTIDLTSVGRALKLQNEQGSHVTIAGQTAPGDGIQLKGYGFSFSNVEDVIVRNIKIRIGNVRKAGDTYQSDPLSVSGSNKRVVLDHLTMNWNVDMGFRVYGSEITMCNCLITKALYYNTPHEKGKHNYAGMFGPKYGSFYNNYIADMGQRAPRIIDNEYIDVRNNVIYNCDRSFDICNYEWMGVNTKFNIVNNAVYMGNPNVSKRSGGSYKYFQGRTYSGGIMSYTVNNTDTIPQSRAKVVNEVEGAIWTSDSSERNKIDAVSQELSVINANEYANIDKTWRNMMLPDNISLDDYDTMTVSKQGNTLVNYPFPADEVNTLDPEDAAKYVFENAGAIYPVNDTLNTRYLTEGRTRLKIDSDYSKCSHKQGIRLTDEDIATMEDPTTAYGLPVETHTIYEDENGGLSYDVDGLNVTDTEGLKIKDQFKFVTYKGGEGETSKNPDVKTLYVYDLAEKNKYRVVTRDFAPDDKDIYDAFEVYDINNKALVKPDNYATVGATTVDADDDSLLKLDNGIEYTTVDGKTVVLKFTELGDGPGNYAHESDSNDEFTDSSYIDTEWTDEDWPQLQTLYRDSREDKERSPELYGTSGHFDSNNDGIPDYFVKLMGWDKRDDYSSDMDISRYDYDGDGYTNIEEYINDYLCGDKEKETGVENEPIQAENIRDGSDKFNTHRSHQILFNTARRAKAQIFYAEGETVDIATASRIDLNRYYDINDEKFGNASDFETYFSVLFPNVDNKVYTGEQESLKPDTTYAYVIKTFSDTGVESLSDVYTFKTNPIDSAKPGAPRIVKSIPFDKQITLRFEPASQNGNYEQSAATLAEHGEKGGPKVVTSITAPKYESLVDHYVLKYSKNADMSDATEILLSGNATSYVIPNLENDTQYYIDLKAVNANGVESDSAVYNYKKAEEQDELDKDGNKTYAVKGITVSKDEIKEYFYDEPFVNHGVAPTKYVVNVDYNKELEAAGIGEGETAKFITYFGDVKDWYIYTLGGIPIPTKDQYSDDKLMLMLRDDTHEHGFTYAKKFDTPLSEKGTIRCRLKIVGEELDPMNQNPELRFYIQEDNASEDSEADTDTAKEAGSFGNIMSISFAKNDINYNGKKIARYEDNQWYDIMVRADSVEKVCSIYINGELIAENLEYSNHNSEGKTAIQRWQLGSRLAGTEDVYVDYMYAYNGWDDLSSGPVVEEGSSGSRPSGNGGGGGGSSAGKKDPIILGGDFNTSPKVDKDDEPDATEAPSSSSTNSQFNDMGSFAWAVPAVNALYEKGVVTGVGNNCFAPDRAVTRAEFITMLMRGFELIGDTATCNFTDVKDGDWCYDAIAMASSMGIVNGLPDGSFGVNQEISRQDMSVMCVRLAQSIGVQLSEKGNHESFTDYNEISDYAKESVDALSKSGIVNGTGDGKFTPKGTANRAQAAKIIYEMIAAQQ